MTLGLRAKLALVALALLALPWAGVLYVNEMERTLLAGQERALIGAARGVATALHDRPQLLDAARVAMSACGARPSASCSGLPAARARPSRARSSCARSWRAPRSAPFCAACSAPSRASGS